jgi:Cro/C1-type HTH DNA-binding domain
MKTRGFAVPNLSRLMAELDVNEKVLAQRAGLHPQTVYFLRRGKKRAQAVTLGKLAWGLGLPDTTALTQEATPAHP